MSKVNLPLCLLPNVVVFVVAAVDVGGCGGAAAASEVCDVVFAAILFVKVTSKRCSCERKSGNHRPLSDNLQLRKRRSCNHVIDTTTSISVP